MKTLLKYFHNYKIECVLGPLFKLLEASFELFIPLLVKRLIDTGIATGDKDYIIRTVVVMVVLGAVGLTCSLIAQYFSAKAAVGFSTDVKKDVFSHLMELSYADIDKLGTSTMITRMTSDINTLQGGVNMVLRLFLRSPFVVLGAVIMAFTIDVRTAVIFVVTVILLSIVVYGIMLNTSPRYRSIQGRLDSITGLTRSTLNGVRVIRAFCNEENEKKAFNAETKALVKLQIATGKISALLNPVTFMIINLCTAWLLWKGAVLVDTGSLSQGDVVALVNYMSQILVELIKLANLIVLLTKALASADRIADILKIDPSMTEGTIDMTWTGKPCYVRFSNVSAKYSENAEPSLEGVSFVAAPGQVVGIIGGTGSGKTTLVNLIPRFYDASEGDIEIDALNVRDYTYEALRKKIAVVPQKSVLFSGTVRDNMLFGNKEATDDEIIEALKIAQAYDFIKEKKDALDCEVTQGGGNFSGGQKQRLCIARALVKKPGILILDDSSSALDFATDAAFRKALKDMPEPPTTFVVSQRTSSVMHADTIIVLDEGKPVGIGTHEDLMSGCETYREIYDSQYVSSGKGASR